jgi:hypothetical protein
MTFGTINYVSKRKTTNKSNLGVNDDQVVMLRMRQMH